MFAPNNPYIHIDLQLPNLVLLLHLKKKIQNTTKRKERFSLKGIIVVLSSDW